MLKSQSQFIRIQPFIQSLRPSVYMTKENCNHDFSQHNSQNFRGDKNERSCRKSMSKSKTLTFKRKTSINMGRQKFCPKWFFNNGQLDIYFNKILSKTTSNSQLKTDRNISAHPEFLNINTIQIQILFTKQETENIEKNSEKKVKMTIKSTQISIQDESKIKRSFTVDLAQKMDKMKCLRIITSQQFKPENIFLNGKLLSCQFNYSDLHSDKICVISPWQLINQQKTFLQNRILSQRPKSKIKWNTQFKENEQQKNVLAFSNLTKRDDVQLNYGLRSPKESLSKSSLRFKSRTNLIIHPNKTQNKFTNVFGTSVKSSFGSTSMSSTFQSINNSDEKAKTSIFAEVITQRKNLFTLPLKFKDQKRLDRREINENQTLTVRPKSSFKNLKEKNEYFQMRQSERKKSLKKDVHNNALDNESKSHKKISPKSSEIKAEYGL